MNVTFGAYYTLIMAVLVLMLGKLMTRHIRFLRDFNIPEPVSGGLVVAAIIFMLHQTTGLALSFEGSLQSAFMLVFFSSIGLSANFAKLREGGSALFIFLGVIAVFIMMQNIVGVSLATVLGLDPLIGLVAGSITLVGGHGTGAAYATRFADFSNIQDVMALAMTSATLGLVLGGVVGGPVAEWLMRRHKLAGSLDHAPGDGHEPADLMENAPASSAGSYIVSLTAALVCLVVGGYLAALVEDAPVSLPNFLWCLATGVLIRNGGEKLGLKLDDRATEIIGTISLSLFLGMTMMTLDLSSVARLAGPLALMLAVQTLVCALYAAWVVFRMLKRDYEAAIMSAAFCGFALGATATAIANMQALTRRHGPAPEAFIVVPVTGAFLVDILNVIVLTSLISLPFVGGM